MITILKKEINDFLNSLTAYIVMGVFLIGIGLLMWVFPDSNVLDYGYADMNTLFSFGPYVLMFLVPAVTMRSFAEEKKQGTLEILFTLPFKDYEIIGGKFLAGVLLAIMAIIPTLIYYFSLSYLGAPSGNIDTPGVIGSYIGLILLSAVFTSIGVFSSSISGNQIVSFIIASFLCFVFYAGFDAIGNINIWSDTSYFIKQLGIMSHYDVLSKGLITLVDITYFLGVIAFLLIITQVFLNIQKG